MSIVFTTGVKSFPTIRIVVDQILDKYAEILKDTPDRFIPIMSPHWHYENVDEVFQDSHRFLFYIPLASTRAIEVWRYGDEMCVCIMPFSSGLETDLALHFIEAFAEYGAQSIFCDVDGEEVGFDFFRKKYSPTFFQLWNASCLRQLMSSVEGDDELYATLAGPVRQFFFGPQLASSLALESDENVRLDTLASLMLLVQFWDYGISEELEQCVAPEVKKHLTGKESASIEADTLYVVPKVDELHMRLDNKVFKISRDNFLDQHALNFPQDQFFLLDEFQFKLYLSLDDIKYLKENSSGKKNITAIRKDLI